MRLNLDELKANVVALADKVSTLKKDVNRDKDVLSNAVKELLDAKKVYADNNEGIGVDGKPYPPLSKTEKKLKSKTSGKGGGGKEKADPNSVKAMKKAAKKAEAKAKKAAASGGDPSSCKNNVINLPPLKTQQKRITIPSKLKASQISYNPNANLTDRPVVALTIACLSNTINDLSIVSDHTLLNGSVFGLSNGGTLVGDVAIGRLLARRCHSKHYSPLGGDDLDQMALIDSWVDYALSLHKVNTLRRVKALSSTLNHVLKKKTHIIGDHITLADIVLFAAIGFPAQACDAAEVQSILSAVGIESTPTLRWMNMMRSFPSIRSAAQLAMGISNDLECSFESTTMMDPLVTGMSPLQGATVGNVVTRFPPEPSGYLHIGHAKAVLMNDYYAKRYKGRIILRFDDTNPSKEKEEFQSSILADFRMLGVRADVVTFTSDYFEVIKQYVIKMINNGLAFMDDTPQEIMQQERLQFVNSKHRNQSMEDCHHYFQLMLSGRDEGSKWCLRAKIDMQSVNGTMRDPVLYRQNTLPHHRTGDKYKAYPTYDLACPVVDSIEGVTHALRTTEYDDRNEQYQWIQNVLGLRRVNIHSFSRMNFQYTVLSKRKLGWFVDNGHVSGWDDARFPTVRGVIRRGVNITALRNFIFSQGASRRIVNMEWGKFWAENKKEIDKCAKRFMAIDKENHVALIVKNAPAIEDYFYLSTDYVPKDPSFGKRLVRIAKDVILEKIDTEGIFIGEQIVLMRWGVVKITKVDEVLEGEFLADGNFKAAKKKLSWMANTKEKIPVTLTEFDNLISKEKLEESDEFKDHINPNTFASSEVIGDNGLKTLQKNEIIQLERRGYYRVDQPYVNVNRGLVLFMIPDGKAKAMSGLSGKLAHR